MSSQTRTVREEERRLSIRTLAIASMASAVAALITSQFWAGGTPIAAAVTPVIVAFVSEVLHKPTQVIATRLTSERTALPADAAVPAAPEQVPKPQPTRDVGEQRPTAERPVAYHRTQPGKRKFAVRIVVVTAALAFVIGAAIVTLPELVAGDSIGGGGRDTTIFGGRQGDSREKAPAETVPSEQPQPRQAPAPAEPDQAAPEQPKTTTQTTPTTPAPKTTPAPPAR